MLKEIRFPQAFTGLATRRAERNLIRTELLKPSVNGEIGAPFLLDLPGFVQAIGRDLVVPVALAGAHLPLCNA